MLKCAQTKCTKKAKVKEICVSLGKRIADVRKNAAMPRTISNELVREYNLTATSFFKLAGDDCNSDDLKTSIERIDRYKSPFCRVHDDEDWQNKAISSIVRKFKNDSISAIEATRIRSTVEVPVNPYAPSHERDFKPLHNDYIRYAMIKCLEDEYVSMVSQLAEDNRNDRTEVGGNENDELFTAYEDLNDRFNNLSRITVEVAIYFLEYSKLNPPESFATLMRGLVKFTGAIADKTLKVRKTLEIFANECLKISHDEVRLRRETSAIAERYKLSYDFIDECINAENTAPNDGGVYRSLCERFQALRARQRADNENVVNIA